MHIKRFINIHMILLFIFILTISGLVYRFLSWGRHVDRSEIEAQTTDYTPDTLDMILPLFDENNNPVVRPSDTIVFFGNSPFADDRDSKDNLVNMIADKTGATVYNCSISNSYLSAELDALRVFERPVDAYNFYWLTQLAVKSPIYDQLCDSVEALGEKASPEAVEVFDTLWKLDFSEVDVIAIMYDASDYLVGHGMNNDDNPTDIQMFTGNLAAGIELIQNTYPWIRIIVMSPTYAFSVDNDGNYISSDMDYNGWGILSSYAILQQDACAGHSVTFVDNIYGTINEDNAPEYLIDNVHLNVEGRKLVADRFVDALYYFDQTQ